ncbi:class I adenylate-forming enzyme family protein [Gordonia hydrophobica]|uniref:AMP-binding protein n=1 Tax=Gordonia hydrophobica TaxID=40516 RepID=A0ABZ2TZ42_9ACTN|nr:AMP-binding protein [Gordonia hydrophobica]MBM7367232.1 acyl-CoA synthetase (AMP-forming)/AMP-acid ligase II [Gordonia hydrophobica]
MAASYFPWDNAVRGEAPCIRDDDDAYSYARFAERVDAVAEQFALGGIGAGDVVAAVLPNRAELILVMAAAWRIGATATPVNPAFTADEAGYQLDDANAALIVGDRPIGDRKVLDVADLATVATTGWTAPTAPSDDTIALLIYTSGSTGRPKGVRLSHANLRFMASSMVSILNLTPADHALLILPLFHVNAICVSVLAPFIAGGQVSVTGQFSVSRFFTDVATLRPTYFSGVPTIYALLVSSPDAVDADLSSVRAAICGAAPISRELLNLAQERFPFPILEGYGLTEGTCASACNPLNGERKLGTVGPALPGQTITIVTPDGTEAPTGEIGEVVISGPSVMQGYLNRPEETAATIVDGRLHTGDVGRLDDDGYLTLVDRIKDMIIRGGENLYPKEIEAALATHPAVLECAVVGAPHELYGEVPVAYVVRHPGATADADELAEHLLTRLARVKRPTAIHLLDDLPRNPVGKIDKPALRRDLVTG